ncbi:type I DNA topoisomerase [Ruminobacter amylophilus]|uniref:type I DNA topoisomerase n=1 Tax=Ruminobacter amylophilus TaxID=867 RepID=UPI0038686E84
MGKSLVIVESPAKAHTINKYLGSNYVVKSSVGHIRDLPSGQAKAKGTSAEPVKRARTASEKDAKLFNRMGINPEKKGWAPQYEILPGKEKVVAELVAEAKKSDYVYLATDLDREGEAIAWHLQEVIGLPKEKFKRVVFNEITKNAITEAFKHPSEVDLNMVNAQQTRRFLDRVVGFMVSPLLWEKVGRGLSAGRVQSVAVRLVVEKEEKIRSFIPEEYWNIDALLGRNGEEVKFALTHYRDKPFHSGSQEETDRYLEELRQQIFRVTKNEEKEVHTAPYPPLNTSSMQQASSNKLGFGVKKTMMLAQALYEAGFITYMRTDSLNLSREALADIRKYISATYGDEYVPEKERHYSSSDNAQNAHEAIRPTDITRESAVISKALGKDAAELYTLIRNSTLACQMSSAVLLNREIQADAGNFRFKVSGKTIKFDGWMKIDRSRKDVLLPDMSVGDQLDVSDILADRHFTRPEARYTEATLVKELEKRGIGRPSTYATIISTIQERGYVKIEQRRFFAEKMGEIVTDRLKSSFNDLMDYDFTREMENKLDDIAENHLDWLTCLNDFYKGFKEELDTARKSEDEGGMHSNISVVTSIACPECHSSMVIKNATTGVFLACSNYSGKSKKSENSCRKTINLVAEDQLPMFVNEDSESEFLRTKRRCPICNSVMIGYVIDEHRKIHICSANPNCQGYEIEEGNFKLKGAEGPTITCDRCGQPMELKNGRFGSYMACTSKECGNTRKILKNGEIAPPREDPVDFEDLICKDGKSHFVLRDGASGIFLASNAFPKVRETRAPKVSELVAHQDSLPEKFRYFVTAPVADGDGNPTVIRFSRKTKKQYVMAENAEGKSTGFTAFYNEESRTWEVASVEKASKTAKATKTAKTSKTSRAK